EGLLNNNPYPGIWRGGTRQSGPPQLLDDVGVDLRRRREIKETVPAKILGRFKLGKSVCQSCVRFLISVIAGAVIEIGGELAPALRIDGSYFGDTLGRSTYGGSKCPVGHGRTGKPHDQVARPQGIMHGEVVQGRNHFALGEISR